jgi:hypothetical protein
LWRYAAILMVAAGAYRIPQLTSSHLLLDGDEAILGVMAKHLAEGREAAGRSADGGLAPRALRRFQFGLSYAVGLAAVFGATIALSGTSLAMFIDAHGRPGAGSACNGRSTTSGRTMSATSSRPTGCCAGS